MPHKCVRCNQLHTAGSLALRNGCECGSKVFVYLSDEDAQRELGDMKWIEHELAHIVEKNASPISLEVENVRVLTKGIFELDVNSLVKNPIVIKDEDGVYYIRLGGQGKKKKKGK
ncbi:Zn-ribbon containing protein [Candidatus Burarchaeum australiense]|nr:Zn-ribbon containing protein [Candidatus Burarchaeum australiense]